LTDIPGGFGIARRVGNVLTWNYIIQSRILILATMNVGEISAIFMADCWFLSIKNIRLKKTDIDIHRV
jgi:hypothetical protein